MCDKYWEPEWLEQYNVWTSDFRKVWSRNNCFRYEYSIGGICRTCWVINSCFPIEEILELVSGTRKTEWTSRRYLNKISTRIRPNQQKCYNASDSFLSYLWHYLGSRCSWNEKMIILCLFIYCLFLNISCLRLKTTISWRIYCIRNVRTIWNRFAFISNLNLSYLELFYQVFCCNQLIFVLFSSFT